MDSCELVSLATIVSCTIAKCAPTEDIPLIAALLGQISGTLALIIVNEEKKEDKPATPEVVPDTEIITVNPFPFQFPIQ